jgi:hypothetical protein
MSLIDRSEGRYTYLPQLRQMCFLPVGTTPSVLTWERPVGAALVNGNNTYRSVVLQLGPPLHKHTHTYTNTHVPLSAKAELLAVDCHETRCTVPHSTWPPDDLLRAPNFTVKHTAAAT